MLGLVLSTVAFFAAAYFINRYLDQQEIEKGFTRRALVGTLASVVAFGAGWVVDKLDGDDANNRTSLSATLEGGDPAQALKALSGLK